MPTDIEGGWDVHMHLVPTGVVRAAERGAFGMKVNGGALHVCGHGVPLRQIGDRSQLVDRLHADKLDGALVSVPPPLFRPDLPIDQRAAYADLVNDSLLDACRSHPAELRPLAFLPMEEPELATRIATALGPEWAGVVIGTNANGLSFAAVEYRPLWSVLSDAGLPVFVHPSASHDPRLEEFYLHNLIGNPFETTIVAAQLLLGGVLERFPRLQIILAHGGGCVAALCGRIQRGKSTARPGIPENASDPLSTIRRFYVDSLTHAPAYLRLISDLVGEDKILLGSDWPFPMGAPDADYGLEGLSADLRQRFRKDNIKSVFGSRLAV